MTLSTEFAAFMFYRPAWFAASLKSHAGVLLGARMHRISHASGAGELAVLNVSACNTPLHYSAAIFNSIIR